MRKLALAVAAVAMLAAEVSAGGFRTRTVVVNRGPVFRPRTVVVRNFGGFHQPVRTFFVPSNTVFLNQGFGTFGVVDPFAVPVSPFGFQTFGTFGGCGY